MRKTNKKQMSFHSGEESRSADLPGKSKSRSSISSSDSAGVASLGFSTTMTAGISGSGSARGELLPFRNDGDGRICIAQIGTTGLIEDTRFGKVVLGIIARQLIVTADHQGGGFVAR